MKWLALVLWLIPAQAFGDARAYDIWLTASGTLAQAKTDFTAIEGVGSYAAEGITPDASRFPDILFRFTTVTSIRDALWKIRIPTGPWGTLSKQPNPPNHEFFGGQYAEWLPPPVPTSFLEIEPGTNIQGVIDANPAGTDYKLKSGTHRQQNIVPKDGDTLSGEAGAVLNGSELLTAWVVDEALWRHDGLSNPWFKHGVCQTGRLCQEVEDVYLNDAPLLRVATKDAVVTGAFAEASNSVWIADDPAGQKLERASIRVAIEGLAENVVLRDLVVEKYASRAQQGTVQLGATWTAINLEARLNHGIGISGRGGAVAINCAANDNGQMGMGGWQGEGGLVLGCEVARNNYAGFNAAWEAGGTKFVANTGMKVRYSCIHDNLDSRGLWFDIDNVGVEMDNNISFGNGNEGIVYEISYRGKMRGNVVGQNGSAFIVWLWGAQLEMQNSSGGVIEDNIVEASGGFRGIALIQQNRGEGALVVTHGPWNIRNSVVRRNKIIFLGSGGLTGGVADFDPDGLRDGNNVIDLNEYVVPDASNGYFTWPGSCCVARPFSFIQGLGIEPNGTLTVRQESAMTFACDG